MKMEKKTVAGLSNRWLALAVAQAVLSLQEDFSSEGLKPSVPPEAEPCRRCLRVPGCTSPDLLTPEAPLWRLTLQYWTNRRRLAVIG
ncbi:hypothetical protein EYF80_048985 [Liparis tanakae]|uniref:Uncharacterized protein n=1 Tax=Liparis tanakae TaxID=230148 RepID=A0A4Z2FIS8_9TELE|nr:hypothetical protein EYF80_048985 [Liparis tanakae]